MVVAQLVERSLPTPEVRDSNLVIGKKLFILNICQLCIKKTKIKKKKPAMAHFLKKTINWKSVDGLGLGIQTWGLKMEGADERTELLSAALKHEYFECHITFVY